MANRQRTTLQFGQGLDRETGVMATKAGSMEDLRNVYLRRGKLLVRKGVKSQLAFTDTDGNAITHVLAGQAVEGLRIGLVVGYQGNTTDSNGDPIDDAGKVFIYRLDADATIQNRLVFGDDPNNPEWFTVSDPANDPPPTIITAEAESKAFFAHDRFSQADREPTLVYDPRTGDDLQTIDQDLNGDGDDNPVKFRGVTSHLDYLFGWGYGTATEARPELLRVSLPGAPKRFDPNHYFIVGDRRSPVVAAEAAGANLIAFKESEVHTVQGTGRHNFGIQKVDSHFGCIGTRLSVGIHGNVFFWSVDGPRVTTGGPSQMVSVPLDLKGFEPSDLPAAGDLEEGFAAYIPEEQVVIWCFDQRVYALNLRGESRGWTYWDLGFTPQCAFSMYGADTGSQSTDAPTGNSDPVRVPQESSTDTEFTLAFKNEGADGDELVELWRRPVANLAWPDWLNEPESTGGTAGVADGWTDGGAATTSYSIIDGDGDGADDSQKIEVTAGSSGEQGYVEKIIGGLSAGQTYRISAHHVADSLTDLEGRIEIAFRDGSGTVLQTDSVTGLTTTDSDGGGLRGYVEATAPANTADVRVRLIAHVTGASPSGSLAFRNVLVHDDDADGAWERYDSVNVQITGTQTEQFTGNETGWFYEVALRHRRAGQFPSAYDNASPADPNTWPDESKALCKADVTAPTLDEVLWIRVGGTEITAPVNYTPHMQMDHRVTVDGTVDQTSSIDNASLVDQQQGFTVSSDDGNISPETNHDFVVEAVHPDGVQVIESGTIQRWMGPEDPLIENIIAGNESATLYWKIQEGDEAYGAPSDGDVRTEISNDVDGLSSYDDQTAAGATNGVSVYATTSNGITITFNVRHFVESFGKKDVSEVATKTAEVGAGGF